MFKKGEKIVYPKYGCSIIRKIYKEEIAGEKKEYYEIQFDDNLQVSIPVDKALEMGMRYPLSKKELQKELLNLNKKVRLKAEDINQLSEYSKTKLSTGKTADLVDLIRTLSSALKERQKINKNLDMSDRESLYSAIQCLRSEVTNVLGKKYLANYNILNVDA